MNKSAKYYGESLPACDVHKLEHNVITPAKYDARLKYGTWGYVCEECFQLLGVGLGVGKGQMLILTKV
jgi:hypothetical protein